MIVIYKDIQFPWTWLAYYIGYLYFRQGRILCTRRAERLWQSENGLIESTNIHLRNTSSLMLCLGGKWGYINTIFQILVSIIFIFEIFIDSEMYFNNIFCDVNNVFYEIYYFDLFISFTRITDKYENKN